MATNATSVDNLTVPAGAVPADTNKIDLRRNANAALTHTSLDDNFHNLTTRVNALATNFSQLLTDLSPIATTGDYGDLVTGQPSVYALPTASTSTKGGVKIGENGNINIDGDGAISVDFGTATAENLGLTIENGWEISGGVLRKKPWVWLSSPHELLPASAVGQPEPSGGHKIPANWQQIQIAGITIGDTTLPSQVNEVILSWAGNEYSLLGVTGLGAYQEVCPGANDFAAGFNFIMPVIDLPYPWVEGHPDHITKSIPSASTMVSGKIVVYPKRRDTAGSNEAYKALQLLAYR